MDFKIEMPRKTRQSHLGQNTDMKMTINSNFNELSSPDPKTMSVLKGFEGRVRRGLLLRCITYKTRIITNTTIVMITNMLPPFEAICKKK